MKVYLIKKWELNIAGILSFDLPWKITSSYDSAIREIKKEELKETEKWNIKYSTNPKNLITLTKVLIADEHSLNMSEKIKQSYEWPLFIYVVSEMEVITE